MAKAGFDGSINIDTSIDSKGFNTGMNKIGNSIKGILGKLMSGFGKVALVVGAVVGAIAAVASALIGAGIAVFTFAQKFTQTLYKGLSSTSAYYDKVLELKNAFDSLKGAVTSLGTTLLSALAPIIMKIINWLVQAINYVSMFIAALTGQKQVMQYVSGSLDRDAKSSGTLAKNTEKTTKAAKGALAAFDQLNVLQMETADKQGGGGGGSGGNMMLKAVDIDPEILTKIEKIKEAFAKAWEWIKTTVLDPVWNWIKLNVVDPIWTSILWLWDIIKESALQLWNGGLKEIFNTFWVFIKTFFVGQLKAGFDLVKNIFQTVLITVTNVITSSIQFFGGLIEFLTGVFTGDWKKAWTGIKDMFKGIFNGIVAIVGGVVNIVVDLINGMIAGVIAGINAVIAALNTIKIDIPAMFGKPAYTFGVNLQPLTAPKIPSLPIPKLATGAVIPPNAQFLAMLGDQRHGTNIEAPLDTIKQAMSEVLGGGGGEMTIPITLTLDGEVIYQNQKKIQWRRGTSLIMGGNA